MRFLLIDRIDRLEIGRRADGHKQIARDEDYFVDHFPGYPIVPGVLLVESLAQLGGRLIEASVRHDSGRRVLPVLGKVERARFVRSVRPGDRLDLAAELVALGDEAARVTGTARVAGQTVAAAELMYALLDLNRPGVGENRPDAQSLLAWSDEVWQKIWSRGVGPETTD